MDDQMIHINVLSRPLPQIEAMLTYVMRRCVVGVETKNGEWRFLPNERRYVFTYHPDSIDCAIHPAMTGIDELVLTTRSYTDAEIAQ
jgi:hypothetical protein